MSSLRQQDRVSSCRFTFSDGRQCRTPAPPIIPTSAIRTTHLFLNSASSASLPHPAIIVSFLLVNPFKCTTYKTSRKC
jgi:hypothetical protein